ncbi:glycogen synthase [Planctomycetaceae bacterium SCGC AG-212-F19]|nr:glycogen synthase [Planctomycetaceae bacterium SCGC AG-212-F19]
MEIVHAASEVVGFAKTGGLADVAGSLPRALARRGHRCTIILPLYHSARSGKVPLTPTDHTICVPVGGRSVGGRLWRGTLPDSDVAVYLIEHNDYFDRDQPAQGRSLYQFTLPQGQKLDYPDNCERFVFFSRAVLETMRILDLWPDVLHNHDWQSGLIPVYLNEVYRRHATPGVAERAGKVRTVFTIHNVAYQGLFRPAEYPLTGLDWRLFNYRQLEFYGQLNLLKAGIVFSDWITTVSARYAEEMQTPYYGYGLQGVLGERRNRLTGIVNGVDYTVWDPASDRLLAERYDSASVQRGKAVCKTALQRRYGLPEEPRAPLLAMIARLVEQKGLDLLGKAGDAILSAGQPSVQLVVLGEGDSVYHRMLQDLQRRYPRKVGLTLAFDEPLAHLIEAGADIFLMPSMFEPSGLNQLYSLKYGTVPVVRACGGLADTIVDCTPQTLADGTATGFSFVAFSGPAFQAAVQRAVEMYRTQPEEWLRLQRNGMQQDWSWNRSAAEYEKVYSSLVPGP